MLDFKPFAAPRLQWCTFLQIQTGLCWDSEQDFWNSLPGAGHWRRKKAQCIRTCPKDSLSRSGLGNPKPAPVYEGWTFWESGLKTRTHVGYKPTNYYIGKISDGAAAIFNMFVNISRFIIHLLSFPTRKLFRTNTKYIYLKCHIKSFRYPVFDLLIVAHVDRISEFWWETHEEYFNLRRNSKFSIHKSESFDLNQIHITLENIRFRIL